VNEKREIYLNIQICIHQISLHYDGDL
jgi:hypothetical protein